MATEMQQRVASPSHPRSAERGYVLSQLTACLPQGRVDLESTTLRRFSCDAAFQGRAEALAVIQPQSMEELRAAIVTLAGLRIVIVPVGAGLSYSCGTLPDREWVAIDMSSIAAVVDWDHDQRYVRVEAGCTWAALRGFLEQHTLRTPFWGTASGLHSTIGGAVGNNAVFFGSGVHGTMAESVLGMTVMLADGTLLHTGVHGADGPLAHPLGPDFTRLFLGSCGAFGVIVEVSLRLIADPPFQRFAGFVCEGLEAATTALRNLGRESVACETLLLSRIQGREEIEAQSKSKHTLSLCVEADTDVEADAALSRAVSACEAASASLEGAGQLQAFRANPFGEPTMLRSETGVRWIPVHAIVRCDQVIELIDAVLSLLEAELPRLEHVELTWNYSCILISGTSVLVEFSFFWSDAGNPLLEKFLGPDHAGEGQSESIKSVIEIRRQIARLMVKFHSAHLQIGRLYDYFERLDPAAKRLVLSVKGALDPQNIFNPGVLGIPAADSERGN
ncbi:MAG: FAD/FMN-containing dehydrogenase [Halieaceae bacterium]|jgi:FAD/FMN-containing dehydrogenase